MSRPITPFRTIASIASIKTLRLITPFRTIASIASIKTLRLITPFRTIASIASIKTLRLITPFRTIATIEWLLGMGAFRRSPIVLLRTIALDSPRTIAAIIIPNHPAGSSTIRSTLELTTRWLSFARS